MRQDVTGDLSCEARLNEALLAFFEAQQAGREPDRAGLLAAHPELRRELEEFFAGHDEVARLTCVLRGGEREAHPPADLGRLGDFLLRREIGRGGMGVVYEAEQISLRRRVALKVLPFAAALDPRQLQRFKNEALAAANLRHENIVPVHAVGEERGVHYYAMQLIDGRSLAALITSLRGQGSGVRGQKSKVGSQKSEVREEATALLTSDLCPLTSESTATDSCPLTPYKGSRGFFEWVATLGRQAALALEHAHSVGVVHRDVKPANLLLDMRGQLWVTDFGLAQVAGDAGLTMTGELCGTLRYASPEQALARPGGVDHRSDIYSLGATLYELLTLRPLFEGRDRNELLRQIVDAEPRLPRSLHPSIPRELETVVLKALGKEPSERYATARELADDLQRFLDHRPVLARRPTAAERLRKLVLRHPSLVAASLVVLVLLCAGSLLSAFLIRGEQGRTRVEQQKAEEAYRRERQRALEAEVRYRLARRCVDEMFRISQEELADRPGLQGPRKRLLRSALAYYQDLLEQQHEDEGRPDLLEAKGRVEKILADLAVLRAASQLYLLTQPAVLDDLQLDGERRHEVKKFCARVGKEWRESFADVGRLPAAERGRRAVERARRYEAEVRVLLTPQQQLRLRQIGLQAEGTAAFAEVEVFAELKLSAAQRERIRTLEEEAALDWMKHHRPGSPLTPAGWGKAASDRITAVLSAEQLERWKEMTGAPLKVPVSSAPPPAGTAGPKEPSR